MPKTLHIVNGDSTAEILKSSNLTGEILVWREMLCEGPIDEEIGSDNFWKKRYDFYEAEFNIGKLQYFDKTIKEILRVDTVSGIDEIVMWFEYDLFCQINLLGLCSFLLQRFTKKMKYYLVCPGSSAARESLKTLGEYHPDDYTKLFEQKIKITRNDLLFCDACWKEYCQNDSKSLTNYNFDSNKKFIFLQGAIVQHLDRFPMENGLNQIDLKLLQVIGEKPREKREIVRKMLAWQSRETLYGFGDLQYFWYIKRLHLYIRDNKGVLELTKKGSKLVYHGN